MTPIRVALRVPVGRPLPDLATFIARCEAAGFDGVGIHDHPSSGRDAYFWFGIRSFSPRLPTAWMRSHLGALTSPWRPVSFRRGA